MHWIWIITDHSHRPIIACETEKIAKAYMDRVFGSAAERSENIRCYPISPISEKDLDTLCP